MISCRSPYQFRLILSSAIRGSIPPPQPPCPIRAGPVFIRYRRAARMPGEIPSTMVSRGDVGGCERKGEARSVERTQEASTRATKPIHGSARNECPDGRSELPASRPAAASRATARNTVGSVHQRVPLSHGGRRHQPSLRRARALQYKSVQRTGIAATTSARDCGHGRAAGALLAAADLMDVHGPRMMRRIFSTASGHWTSNSRPATLPAHVLLLSKSCRHRRPRAWWPA